MAESSVLLAQDEFSCSVCLDLLKNPVTIHCGHSYCMVCINKCWDQEDLKGIYSCPHCRHTFTSRPAVSKNTMLAEVVEKLKKTRLQAAPHAHSSDEPEDVECDFCTGIKHKAVQSCLVCLASFCEDHLQPHYQSLALKRHKLVKASRCLQEQICSQHDKLLEVYCRTDQQCICMQCTMDDHKGHDTVSLSAERSEKQKQVVETQRKYKERIQEREKELQELTEAVETHKRSAQTAVQDSEKIFTEMIRSIERRHSEVRQMIRDQEKAAVSEAEERLKRLEQEITELKRRDADLEKLSLTEDHVHFLQSFQTLSAPPGSSASPAVTLSPLNTFEDVMKSVSQLRGKLEEFWKEEFEKKSAAAAEEPVDPWDEFELNPLLDFSNLTLGNLDDPPPPTRAAQALKKPLYLDRNPGRDYSFLNLDDPPLPTRVRKPKITVPPKPETRKNFLQFPQALKKPLYLGRNPGLDYSFLNLDDRPLPTRENTSAPDGYFTKQEVLGQVRKPKITVPPKLKTREDFLQYSCQLTLDPNTANYYLLLSERNTVVTRSDTFQPYPDHPERFDGWAQVLCRESVSGRCYWEVEWRGDEGVFIAVSYKSISRKEPGEECGFGGDNYQSWSLVCDSSSYAVRYNNTDTIICRPPVSSRIGVYVDHRAGTLSFYSISDTMTLIHRVQTTFTQPLYAGFWVGSDSSVNLSLSDK